MKQYKSGISVLMLSVIFYSVFVYFDTSFNSNVISFELKNNIETTFLEEMVGSEIPVYELRYTKEYGEGQLIMTTGQGQYFSNQPIYSGRRVSKNIRNGVVIGDEIAGQEFRELDVIGEPYDVLGKEYTIIGILENSKDIMIPFNSDFNDQHWVKRYVSFHIKNKEIIPAKQAYVRTQLNLNGGQIRTNVVHYEYGLFFKNLSVVVIILWLISYFFYWLKKFHLDFARFKSHYTEEKIRKLTRTILKEEKKEVVQLLLKAMIMLLILGVSYGLVLKIEIPKRLIANSIMSASSWYDLFDYYFDQLMISFNYGFYQIRRDFIVAVVGVGLLCSRLTYTYMMDKKVNHEK